MKNETNEIAYWITLAHSQGWKRNSHKYNLVSQILPQNNLTIRDFFSLKENDWIDIYSPIIENFLRDSNKFSSQKLDEIINERIKTLNLAKSELANNSFLAETLINQGFDIIPITSSEYSPILKENLSENSPLILYTKGNKEILQEDSIAVVGSRNATEISLQFTDNIVKNESPKFKVIVSGFARGVDKQALDSALECKGQSIIVLPQGILTFTSGIKKYYKYIQDGDLLVLSTFQPNSGWSVGNAMGRNPIIYGLAKEIFVAESGEKGGTISGVRDGLKKNRTIYVRKADEDEKNANNDLIKEGAIPVDMDGSPLHSTNDENTIYQLETQDMLFAD